MLKVIIIFMAILVGITFYSQRNKTEVLENNLMISKSKKSNKEQKKELINEQETIYKKVGTLKSSSSTQKKLTDFERNLLESNLDDIFKNPPEELSLCLKEKDNKNECFNLLIKQKLVLVDQYFPNDSYQKYSDEILFQKMLGKILGGGLTSEIKNFQKIVEELKNRGVESFQVEKWDTLLKIGENDNIRSEDVAEMVENLKGHVNPTNEKISTHDFIEDLEIYQSYLAGEERQKNDSKLNFKDDYLTSMLELKNGNLSLVKEKLELVANNEMTKSKTREVTEMALKICNSNLVEEEKIAKLKTVLVPIVEVDLNVGEFMKEASLQ